MTWQEAVMGASGIAFILVITVVIIVQGGATWRALGTLMRSQVVGLGIALMALFVVEPVLTELIDGYQRYSLTGVRVALIGGDAEAAGAADGGLPPAWLAALLWTGYTVALVTAAITVTRRRDV